MKRLFLGGESFVIGCGSLAYLEKIKANKAFIVTGSQSMIKNGIIGKIEKMLQQNHCETLVYAGVSKNPDTGCVLDGVKKMQEFMPDLVIAIGGGSPMDAAKVMTIFYEYPELTFEHAVKQGVPNQRTKVKLIAIPTTSGTASEVTRAAVVTFKDKNIKIGLKSDAFIPDVAIVDAELTVTMPDHIVAETGMDAMTHAVEAYCNDNLDDFTEVMARGAVQGLYTHLPISYREKTVAAREKVHHYQSLAGFAFTNVGLGMVHGIAHAIGGQYDEAHGLINAVALPYVLEYNRQHNPKVAEKLVVLAKAIDVEDFVQAIRALNHQLHIPASFQAMGISQADFQRDFDLIVQNSLQGSTKSNPVKMNQADMEILLKKIYDGIQC